MFRRPFFPQAALLPLLLPVGLGAGCARDPGGQQPADAGITEDAEDAAAFVCNVQPPTVCPDPPPHYPDIAQIITLRCVPCHNGTVATTWPLLQYSHLADWNDLIRTQMIDCSMPPPDAGVPMTNDERIAILTWILCGFLE
jgi:hypothetical protein